LKHSLLIPLFLLPPTRIERTRPSTGNSGMSL